MGVGLASPHLTAPRRSLLDDYRTKLSLCCFKVCLSENGVIYPWSLIFHIEMVAIGRHLLSKIIRTVRHENLAVLCSKAKFIFDLLNTSLRADRDRLRSADSFRLAMSPLDPSTHSH